MKSKSICSVALCGALLSSPVYADPCGMVPPIWSANVPNVITRVGPQQTYVFFEKGMETFVIRPAFSGKIDQFGMLIPFPSPPAIRKVDDNIFDQVKKAIDPPMINLWVRPQPRRFPSAVAMGAVQESAPAEQSLKFDQVRVLKQEAVGMYEVAVLEAGSAGALKRWMEDHEYRFPDGMEDTTNEYVKDKWCFVAIKARVGNKGAVQPKPGMRKANPQLPAGATFDGAVQAMGFRFKTKELVVPMRLSAFNKGRLRNVMYLMSDRPLKVRQLESGMVRRQISGKDLDRNLNTLLPVRVRGGRVSQVTAAHLKRIRKKRDPKPHNGLAFALFASDLKAAQSGELSHPHESSEKALLNIGESLGLRGKEIDALHRKAIKEEQAQIFRGARKRLRRMTLTVIDGDFPRDLLAQENLRFERFAMKRKDNHPGMYDAKNLGPGQPLDEMVFWGRPKHLRKKKWWRVP